MPKDDIKKKWKTHDDTIKNWRTPGGKMTKEEFTQKWGTRGWRIVLEEFIQRTGQCSAPGVDAHRIAGNSSLVKILTEISDDLESMLRS